MSGSKRRGALALLTVMVALVAAASSAFAAPARAHLGSSNGSGNANEALAKLVVTQSGVAVKAADKSAFKAARDGQDLREGDTVRTDATGLAEIDYSDTSYTRLDVATTFTIKKLTDEQGARQVQGSLDTGRTWNRTATLTESGSFEQEGAGANATVLGTVFTLQCDTPDLCVFLTLEHVVRVTGADNVIKELTAHAACDSKSGVLCPAPRILSISELASISWVQDNLGRDQFERGLGNGPFAEVGGNSVTRPVTQALETVAYDFSVTPPPPPPGTEVGGISTTQSVTVGGVTLTEQDQLPFTGSNQTNLYVGVGIALLLAGAALLIATARRRRSEIGIDA